jgi:hypothetical protein
MLAFASFNHGNPVIGWLLLPIMLVMPWIMLWIEVRSVLKGEALSKMSFFVLLAYECFAAWLAWRGVFADIAMLFGFWKTWVWALLLATAAAPFILAYEAYKHGWLNRVLYPPKKKRQRTRKAL